MTMTPESGNSRERWRRIATISRRVFFTVIATLPAIAHFTHYDPVVILCGLGLCLFAGVVLDSSPIVFMLLSAFFGGMCLLPSLSHRHNVWDDGAAIFVWAFLGLVLGLLRDASRKQEKPISYLGSAKAQDKEFPPTDPK